MDKKNKAAGLISFLPVSVNYNNIWRCGLAVINKNYQPISAERRCL